MPPPAPPHRDDTTARQLTCREYEAKQAEYHKAHVERFVELTTALGNKHDDCPTWEVAHARNMAAIRALKDEAVKQHMEMLKMRGERGEEKAKRVEAVRALLKAGRVRIPDEEARQQELLSRQVYAKGVECKCKTIHNGMCTSCGKDHVFDYGGTRVVPDSRMPNNGTLYGIEAKDYDRWKGEMVNAGGALTVETMQRAMETMRTRGGAFNPSQTTEVHAPRKHHGDATCASTPRQYDYDAIMAKARQDVEQALGVPKPLLLAPSESGPGLRAQGGKYTEPGNTIIYCDNGNDDI